MKVQNKDCLHLVQNKQFEEVGFALNKAIYNDYLRKELGFLGYVNSDTSAVIDKAWGALDLSVEAEICKSIECRNEYFFWCCQSRHQS